MNKHGKNITSEAHPTFCNSNISIQQEILDFSCFHGQNNITRSEIDGPLIYSIMSETTFVGHKFCFIFLYGTKQCGHRRPFNITSLY